MACTLTTRRTYLPRLTFHRKLEYKLKQFTIQYTRTTIYTANLIIRRRKYGTDPVRKTLLPPETPRIPLTDTQADPYAETPSRGTCAKPPETPTPRQISGVVYSR